MRRPFIYVACLLWSIGLKAQETEKAESLIYYQRYNSAEALLKDVINNNKNNDETVFLLTKTLFLQDKRTEANDLLAKHYTSVTNKNDLSAFTKLAYVWALLEDKKKEDAQAITNELLSNKKNQKNARFLAAVAETYLYSKSGLVNEAIELLNQAAEKDGKNPAIYILMGDAYRQQNDGGKAVQSYSKALEINPAYAKAKFSIGKVYLTQQNSSVFLNEFFQTEQMDSTYSPTYYELYYYYYFRDVKLAKKYLAKYIQHTDHTPELDYTMTDLLYVSGEYDQAIKDAQELLTKQQDKAEPRLYKLIAYCYDTLGQKDKALEFINTYFQKSPEKNYVAHDFELKARLLAADSNQLASAVELYQKAVSLDTVPDNKVKYMSQVVNLYKKQSNNAEAARWMGEIYSTKPSPSNMDLYNWGVACFTAENYQLSDSVFALYTDKYADQIHGYYWRAKCNALIDTAMEKGLAIPHYEKVIEIGQADSIKNKAMLTRSYGYVGSYYANVVKDYEKSLSYFEKYLMLEPENKEIQGYADLLQKRIDQKNNKESGQKSAGTSK